MAIIIDTSVIISYYNSADSKHQITKALIMEIRNGVYGRAITSTYVIDELLSYFLKKVSEEKAKSLSNLWITKNEGFASIVDVGWTTFKQAADLFQNQDQNTRLLSFTDCIIIINAREHQIDTIATFDAGFHQYLTVIPSI